MRQHLGGRKPGPPTAPTDDMLPGVARVSRALARHTLRFGGPGDTRGMRTLSLPLPQEDLAMYLGYTRTTVVPLTVELARQGAMCYRYGRVATHLERLRRAEERWMRDR